jgi:glycine dehydrogenase subunit 2
MTDTTAQTSHPIDRTTPADGAPNGQTSPHPNHRVTESTHHPTPRRPDAPTTLYDLSAPGRRSWSLPEGDVPERPAAELLPGVALRETLDWPEVGELDLMRHFVRLSQKNHGIDTGFYPLGSCTMKYNPKINEEIARLPGIADIHPLQRDDEVQGALELMWRLQQMLAEISGLPAVTLQPAAGAHGEFCGLLIIHKHLRHIGQHQRTKVVVPDSSHGTNPATAARCGFTTVSIKSGRDGRVDLHELEKALDDQTAALMLTNPNTLGLFESDIRRITDMVHQAGGLVYCDGANMNAILGVARPGDMGFDVMHFNVHKTFSTPHGGGGPGGGPVAVRDFLEPYLPVPVIVKDGDLYRFESDRPLSIGKLMAFAGNFGILARAYAYLRTYGNRLREVSEMAVLNANYVAHGLKDAYDFDYGTRCMHECVLSARRQKRQSGVRALDVAKRLMDFGIHPPTIYFPLIPGLDECMMVEPTETETRETLDHFCARMSQIAREAEESPELVKDAPHVTPVGRLDEAQAARRPDLAYRCCG